MSRPTHHPHPEAHALAAQAWADHYERLDLQLAPLGFRAIEALSPKPGEAIVDVGCGAGQTVLQLAQRVGADGRVIGVDIAPSLLNLARRRAEPEQSIDGFFSRFGVMALADPIGAFSNFRRMMRPSGRLAFVCWRALSENELDLLPLRAAGLEAMVDPTPFSFADPDRVRTILKAAGFHRIDIEAYDEPVSSGDLDATAAVLLSVGPLGKILRENPELLPEAEPRLRAALGARGPRSHVALTAATWIVTAQI
jgi:SAM-dependent methyltransferase